MKFMPLFLLAGLLAAPVLRADDATAAADKPLEPFARELKGGYPSHVAGCTVAKGHVTRAGSIKYCPMRTARCGEGARCGHPMAKDVPVFDIAVDAVVFTNVKGGAPAPAEFKNWHAFSGGSFSQGDAVLFSFYTYANGVPPAIVTIVKAPAPAAQPAPAGAAVAHVLGEGYFVKNTHAIPASGADFLWLDTQAAFDEVFQKTPPLMGARHTDPVVLESAVALAVIHQGNCVPEIKVTAVTVKDGAVEVAYTLARPAEADNSAVFAVPLIVVVEKAALAKAGGAKEVRFIGNGKPAGTARAPGK